MALPTAEDLQTMDWAYQAQPFVRMAASENIDLFTLDWAYQAQPFVGNPRQTAPPPTFNLAWALYVNNYIGIGRA